MKKSLLEMLKLSFCDVAVCAIAYIVLNFSFDFCVQIFGYVACLFIVPYLFRRTDTALKGKLCMSAMILAVSFAATIYAEGVGRTLFRNIIVFAVMLIVCMGNELRKASKP